MGEPAPAPGAGPNDFSHLVRSYINAVTKPNAETYAGEMRNASWAKVVIGVVVVAVVTAVMSPIVAAASRAALEQIRGQFGDAGLDPAWFDMANATSNPVWAFLSAFITFPLGALLIYVFARLMGGRGGDLMTHFYLLSLSWTPLSIVRNLVRIIPCLGDLVYILLFLYQIYCAGLALQAGQRMEAGRAQMVVWLSFVIVAVLVCLGLFLCAGLFIAMVGGMVQSTSP